MEMHAQKKTQLSGGNSEDARSVEAQEHRQTALLLFEGLRRRKQLSISGIRIHEHESLPVSKNVQSVENTARSER